ncbi:hypothetical protein Tco_0096874 [Tanacetum coccineum]
MTARPWTRMLLANDPNTNPSKENEEKIWMEFIKSDEETVLILLMATIAGPYIATVAYWRSRVTSHPSSSSEFPIAPVTAPPRTR